MADLYLPETPLPKAASVIPIVFGGWQTPPTGGEETWLALMGTRFALELETPNLLPEPDGRLWTDALLDGLMEGLIVGCRFFQPGFKTKAFAAPNGSIEIDGPNQAGSILNLRGFEPYALVHKREFFGIITGGLSTLYRARAQTIADANGKMALPIGPMLHVQPNDGDVCDFGTPMIEGKLTGDKKAWTMIPARVQGLTFTISETR